MRPIARRALAAQSDERLVRLLRDGHGPAFEEIVRRYRSPLVAFATAMVSGGRAEDVVQTSLEKAHRALLADARDVALRPWLFTIVRNTALNAIRAEPMTDELVTATATVPGPSEAAERSEELDRLVVAICALPAAQREALVKRELEGVGHGEIAAQLGTTAAAVRGLIFRARTTVRNAVGAAVPLPVLRALLAKGSAAAGVAGSGVGAGTGAALLGGTGVKGAAALATAIVAIGAGVAIERDGRKSDGAQAATVAASDAREGAGRSSAADRAVGGTSGRAPGEGAGSEAGGRDANPAGTSPGGAEGAEDSSSGQQSSGGSEGSEGSSGGGHGGDVPEDSEDPQPDPSPPPPSGSGHEGGHEGGELEPPDDGPSEWSNSGPGSYEEPEPEPEEPREPELEAPELEEPEEHGGSGPH